MYSSERNPEPEKNGIGGVTLIRVCDKLHASMVLNFPTSA